MATRYKKITDPDGNDLTPYERPFHAAFIEKLDGRNPLFKYFKYRFSIRGTQPCAKFLEWMTNNFGPSMSYSRAKVEAKFHVDLSDVKWVLDRNTKSYYDHAYIYFNKDCEVLVRLTFTQGAAL